MKFIFWLISIPLSLCVLLWAIINADYVSFQYLPVLDPVTIPVFSLFLAALGGGFIWGALSVWLLSGKERRERRELKKQLRRLEKEMTDKPAVTTQQAVIAAPDLPF
ncbi:MAG: DUF1049 domain-containing protein [Alphaproteobacteria bacterium]|nr:DUF1049 domain-containing protein [Alphaproteobacteria bacterium]